MSDILVHAGAHNGAFDERTLGTVAAGARLAHAIGGEAHALVCSEALPSDLCAELGAQGATVVYRAPGPDGLAQPAIDALACAMARHKFGYVLFGGGLVSLEAAAGLAARLGAGIAIDVTDVEIEQGRLVALRPALGDSRCSRIAFHSAVGIIVTRLGAFAPGPPVGGAAVVEALECERSAAGARVRMVRHAEFRGERLDIETADVLIAGGRGLGGAGGFELCEELAAAFAPGSAVAATRAAVDLGWYPYAAQVGQTGKVVSPKLYVAAGISGAVQHRVGMRDAENVVAINTDRGAPIFSFCDLGIVGDANTILPRLSAAVRARRNK